MIRGKTVVTKMPSPQGAVAGQTAIFNIPLGLTFHEFMIRYQRDVSSTLTDASQAHFASDLTGVRLILNSDTIWNAPASVIDAINGHYQRPFTAGILSMVLDRKEAETLDGQDLMSLGTANKNEVNALTLEIDIAAGVVTPTLSLYAVQSEGRSLGQYVALRKFSDSAAFTGENEYANVGKGQYGLFAAHFDTANITNAVVEINQRKVFEADRVTMAQLYAGKRTIQSGFTPIDFANDNRVKSAIGLNPSDLRFKMTHTSAESFNIYMERAENIAA